MNYPAIKSNLDYSVIVGNGKKKDDTQPTKKIVQNFVLGNNDPHRDDALHVKEDDGMITSSSSGGPSVSSGLITINNIKLSNNNKEIILGHGNNVSNDRYNVVIGNYNDVNQQGEIRMGPFLMEQWIL